MTARANSNDYRQLFLDDVPLLDVRAPIEFLQGAFPSSTNIALLDDEQRKLIGTQYKHQGQDAAIALGWQIATKDIQQHRIDSWREFVSRFPGGYLYCFRGGLRSKLSQQLLSKSGIEFPIVEGGYKAMRRFLINNLETISKAQPYILVGGQTGSGKTDFLTSLSQHLDLEGAAKHRGSAFGAMTESQPSQIDFENTISISLLKMSQSSDANIFLEDEGKLIGRINLPLSLRQAMQYSPRIILTAPLGERISRIVNDYVIFNYAQLLERHKPELAQSLFRVFVVSNLKRIQKRLGGVTHQKIESSFQYALNEFYRTGHADFFRPGVQMLLTDYYDPMYQYQQSQRDDKILFSGDRQELSEWAKYRTNANLSST